MLVPAHLIDGWSFRAGIEFASIKFSYTAISTSWTLERGPCRKPSGGGSDRYSLSSKGFTSHQRMFVDGNIFPAIAVGEA